MGQGSSLFTHNSRGTNTGGPRKRARVNFKEIEYSETPSPSAIPFNYKVETDDDEVVTMRSLSLEARKCERASGGRGIPFGGKYNVTRGCRRIEQGGGEGL